MGSRRGIWAAAVLLGAGSACVSEGPAEEDLGVCGDLSRAQQFRPGLAPREGEGDLEFRWLLAEPDPPNEGDNLWTVALSDGDDGPTTDCACVASGWMPDHNAGATIPPACSPGDSPQFLEVEVDVMMPGLWEVTLEVECQGSSGSALFAFCAEG